MIYVTGDCHGDFTRFSNKNYGKYLSEEDVVIVCGDFGLLWVNDGEYAWWRDFLSSVRFTILWVDGNHENFNWLYEFPVETWNGGKVRHIIKDKCIHLERGQVFNIDNKSIFTFGGAQSHDIQGGVLNLSDSDYVDKVKRANRLGLPYRVLNKSWWEQELPTEEEMQEGLHNLKNVGNRVDYVVSHCVSSSTMRELSSSYSTDKLTDYFDIIKNTIDFKFWYFGHYHKDLKLMDNKHRLLYKSMYECEGTN